MQFTHGLFLLKRSIIWRTFVLKIISAPSMKRAILLFFVIIISSLWSAIMAQNDEMADTTGDNILFRKELYGAAVFHSAGWGISYRTGQNRNYYNKKMFEFDLVEMKSPKEVKRVNANFSNSRRYVYGKMNNLYLLRAGYGVQKLLNRKPYWGGIEVRFFYYGGLSIGFAKPVYLYIANYTTVGDQLYYDITTEKYDPDIHFPWRTSIPSRDIDIYGKAPIYKGFGEIRPYPGGYMKFGFNFEYGSYNQSIKAIEVGATIDAFPKAVPIMAFNDPLHFFVNVYVSLTLGKRYN
jgi:hypothetical protein